jgi:hypothetical protein
MRVKPPKTIRVTDDAELGPLLDEARNAPLVLERGT